MDNNKIRVAITQGDTNGIGFELIFKTFSELEMFDICTPIIYGSPKVAAYHSKALGTECPFTIINNAKEARNGKLNILACTDEEIKVDLGQSTNESRAAAVKALDRALADSRSNLFDVLVCCPASSEACKVGAIQYPATEQLIQTSLAENQQPLAVHACNDIRVVIVAPDGIKDALSTITSENVQNKAKLLYRSLRRDFRIVQPRVAVLALNPTEGKEETEILAPAVTALSDEKLNVFGPYKADAFFSQRQYEHFDGIIAMHYDQGIIPMRLLDEAAGVKLLTNMPLVCTMPDTDEQFAIAGQNLADPSVLRNAIYLAIDVQRHRMQYDAPLANPLEKLYHERPDSGEKLRFSIPKKKDNE